MGHLLDGIRKLKAQRQEASNAPGIVAEKPDELTELISLYSVIGKKSELVRGENSTATDQDKSELERMEKSFSFRWDNLSEGKQKELVDRLLEAGLLPENVRQVRDMFNGKVVSLL
jgi:hypothetical protein